MRSFSALALGLSIVDLSSARVALGQNPQAVQQDDNGVLSWFSRLFREDVESRQNICVEDSYYSFVNNNTDSFGENFCRGFMNYPDNVVVVDTTPVSTTTDVYETRVATRSSTFTPVTTVTASGAAAKRDAAPMMTEAARNLNAAELSRMMKTFQRQNAANGSSVDPAAFTASFSSACGCQTYGGTTTTRTSTHSESMYTVRAYQQTVTTVVQTAPASTVTVSGSSPQESSTSTTETATVPEVTVVPETTLSANSTQSSAPTGSPEMSIQTVPNPPSTTVATSGPAPTAPAFSCPDDNNSTVSQMVGNERYDYLILCDTDILDPDSFKDFNFKTLSECAAACSVGDQRLNTPACQGFAYWDAPNNNGFNCFLKSTVNQIVPALGIDSGILQRVAVGISGEEPQGTTTEAGPFGEATADPAAVSSAFDEALSGSSSSISVVTAAPLWPSGRVPAADGITSYSTYVSDGTTFSTGTAFSTYVSANGSWYSAFYTSFSLAWGAESTVYGYSDGGTSVSNVTDSDTSVVSGENGDYGQITVSNVTSYFPGGYNVTSGSYTTSFHSDGSAFFSTSTVDVYTYQTGSAAGGAGGSDAGVITSTFPGSSFASIFTSSGGTAFVTSGAASGGQPAQTPAPSTSVTTIFSSGGTAFSTGFIISGVVSSGGIAGANNTEASGAVATPVSSGAFSTGLSGGSGTIISGAVSSTGLSGQSSAANSGVIPSSGSLTPISSTIASTGISGASSFASSGVVPSSGASLTPISSSITSGGTGFFSATEASGSLPSSGRPFTNSLGTRSGSLPPSSAPTGSLPVGTAPTGSAPSGTAPTGQTFLESIPPYTGGIASESSRGPSPYSSGRTPSGTAPLGTGPSGYPSPSRSAPSGGVPSGTVPLGTSPVGTSSRSVPFSAPTGTRSGTLSSSSTAPPGTAPVGTAPINTGSSRSVPFSAPSGTRSGTLPPSGTVPGSTGTTAPPPPVYTPGTSRAPSSGFPPYPTAASSCVTNFLGTTTILVTTTEFGCYSYCVPNQGGYFGGGSPQTFGGQGPPQGPPTGRPGSGGNYGNGGERGVEGY